MKKLNITNINSSLSMIKEVGNDITNSSYEELVPLFLIDKAEKNTYAEDDNIEIYEELAEQIEAVGLINPLGVVKKGNRYQLFSGEKRFNAISKILKWEKVPCRVFENVSDNKAQLMLHIANTTREYTAGQKLRLYDEYNTLLQEMKDSGEYTGGLQKGIANLLNISERQVRKYKVINDNLSADEKEKVISGEIQINEATNIATQKKLEPKEDTTKELEKSGTSSAFTEETVAEPQAELEELEWDTIIRSAILIRYDSKQLLEYYTSQIPTPAEAVKILNRDGGGICKFENGLVYVYVKSKTLNIKVNDSVKVLKLTEVDELIRKYIREKSLKISEDERNEILTKIGTSSYFYGEVIN